MVGLGDRKKGVWLQLNKSTSLGLRRSRLLPCRKKKGHLCERKDDWRRSATVVLNRKPPAFTGGSVLPFKRAAHGPPVFAALKRSLRAVRSPFEALRPNPALRRSRGSIGWGQGPASRLCGAEAVAYHAVAMQLGATDVEPGLGPLHVRTDAAEQAPKPHRVVHFHEVGNFVSGEVVEHKTRRQHQTPRKRQRTAGRARAPPAHLVPDRKPPHLDAKTVCVTRDRGFKVALGLALEIVGDPPGNMSGIARNAEQPPAIAVGFGPYGAARAAPVRDSIDDAPQGNFDAVFERRGPRQPGETRRDPGAVPFGKLTGLAKAAARRHGENGFARHSDAAQRIAAGVARPTQREQHG